MADSSTLHFRKAEELFHEGKFEEALHELYVSLWNNTACPEAHLLLWDILEHQRTDRQRIELLRDVVDNPLAHREGAEATSPLGVHKHPPYTHPRQALRYTTGKQVILVGYDSRSRFFAELTQVEEVSLKGASVMSQRGVPVGDQVHLFGSSGKEEDYVVALVRNIRTSQEDGRRRLGIEFLNKPGKWLLPDELQPTEDQSPSD
jgi:hypothetical protein